MKRMLAAALLLCCLPFIALGESAAGEAVLTFSSFEGGGPEAWITLEDPSIAACRCFRSYDVPEGEPIPPGAGYTETCVISGLKPGTTTMTVSFGSALVETRETVYTVTVDDALKVTLFKQPALSLFRFSRGGYIVPQSYEVFVFDGDYYLCKNQAPSHKLAPETVDGLLSVIRDYDLTAWDGFQESALYVLDGEGFTLEIAFADGGRVWASGENAFPPHYHEAVHALESLLDAAQDERPDDLTGTYQYAGQGFGGDFTLTLLPDGTYTFYEGFLSSYLGGGEWRVEGPRLYLYEQNGLNLDNTFLPLDGALYFVEADSDGFPSVRVPDGGRFDKTGPAPGGKTAELSFASFDGGGPEYRVKIEDPEILSCSGEIRYRDQNHEEIDGAGYDVVFTFSGKAPGSARVHVLSLSPIVGNEKFVYDAAVDENLNVTLEPLTQEDLKGP